MQFEIKRIVRYGIMLVLGLSLMVYGFIDLTTSRYSVDPMTDDEIVERAKELGMVSIKEKWIEEQDSEKTTD